MPQYPVTQPIQNINPGAFPFQVNKDFIYQYFQETSLIQFTGASPYSPIVKHEQGKGKGWQYNQPRLSAMDYKNAIMNFDQVRGRGQQPEVDIDYFHTDQRTFYTPIFGPDLLAAGTPLDLPAHANYTLLNALKLNYNWSIFKSALDVFVPGTVNATPVYDRFCGNLTQAVYESAQSLQKVADDVVAAVGDSKLNTTILRKLAVMAQQGGHASNKEDSIRPAYIDIKGGQPRNSYIYFGHPAAIDQLLDDPLYQSAAVSRGVILDSREQPQAIFGDTYKGMFQGIHLYSTAELTQPEFVFTPTNEAPFKVVIGLFVGAAAWGVGWSQYPELAYFYDPIEKRQDFAVSEIRGQKAIMYPSRTNGNPARLCNQGIIYTFTTIPA